MSEDRTKQSENKKIKVVISFIVAVIDINLVVSLEVWTKSASRIAVMLFGGIGAVFFYLLIDNLLKKSEKRLKIHSLVWGIPMAIAYVLGCRMRRDGTALAGLKHLPGLIVQIGCLTVLAAAVVSLALCGRECMGVLRRNVFLQNLRFYKQDGEQCGLRKQYRFGHVWFFSSLVIFICWIPVFLAYYPSVFAYDAEGQLYQVIAHDYSTHHPLLHTLFLGAFFKLGGNLSGSYSAGMAVHSVIQMTLMSAVFGYVIAYLYRKDVSVYVRSILLLFYALFPTNSILALSTTKDVLFSALVLLYTFALHGMVTKPEHGGDNESAERDNNSAKTNNDGDKANDEGKKNWLLYILWTVLMLLFRNNAMYALILAVPCVWFGLYRMRSIKPGMWKKYLICTVAAFVLFALGSISLKEITGARNGSPREMLSVPLQQMARTRVKAEETLPPAMRQEVEHYLPSEWVFAAYNPYLADPVKNRAVIHDNPAGLIKTWIELGVEHPQIYIDAFLDNSIGYWFIEDRTHAQIYGIGTESGFGYLSTDNRTMPAGCEIIERSYLPGLRAYMERIVSENSYQKLPVVRIIFAPAFYWWMLCMYMAVMIYRRAYKMLLPIAFLVIYYLTLLLSPAVLIRYMYPFVVTVPAICCCLRRDLDEFDGKIYNKN
ncbi:MAG: hypothetical protein K2L82_05970 [Lachnospiraceae bacterium]|nr:hypothetical protein [Lachnospiraceae bacterium]